MRYRVVWQRLFALLIVLCIAECAVASAVPSDNWQELTVWRDLEPLYSKAAFPASAAQTPVLFVWNGKHNGNVLLEHFAMRLMQAVPATQLIQGSEHVWLYAGVPNSKKDAEEAVARIVSHAPGLVVFATGDCRVCAAWMAVEASMLEMRGVPTVALLTQPFYKTYISVCQNMRVPQLAVLVATHPVAIISTEKVQAKADLLFEAFQKLFQDKR